MEGIKGVEKGGWGHETREEGRRERGGTKGRRGGGGTRAKRFNEES